MRRCAGVSLADVVTGSAYQNYYRHRRRRRVPKHGSAPWQSGKGPVSTLSIVTELVVTTRGFGGHAPAGMQIRLVLTTG